MSSYSDEGAKRSPKDGTLGIWLNKRALRLLELPFRHDFRSLNDGWEVDVLEGGKVMARFLDGDSQGFDVEPGDALLSSREEMYLALRRARDVERDEGDEEDGEDEGRRDREERRRRREREGRSEED
jgi:hypothetical protein